MARAYAPPEGFEPPDFDEYFIDNKFDNELYTKSYEDYVKSLVREAKADAASRGDDSALIGEKVRWQRGDGYAEYIVWSSKPLELIHVPFGDAYTVEDALIRGLRLSDVKGMVERENKLREIFSK